MTLPCGWDTKLLGKLILEIGDGGTPKTTKSEYFGGKIPWVNIQDISKIISETRTTLTQQGFSSCSAKLWPAGTVILSTGATIGEVGIAQVPLTTKQGIHGIVCNKHIHNWFLYYKLQFLKNFLNANAQGSTIKEVRGPFIRTIPISFPISIEEQSKIAEVLSTVDKAIEQTEDLIAKQQGIKTGLMQDLLTKGIDEDGNLRSEKTHEFKDSPLGRIPAEWDIVKLKDLLYEISEPISMKNNEYYQLISIRRRNGGIFKREILSGKKILTKDLHRVIPGTFLIANRQIVHGACAYVTTEFEGMVVSSAYTALKGKENCNIEFFSWIAKTPLMYKYFLDASQGVVLEKMNFHLDEWLEYPIFLPALSEQEAITNILDLINCMILEEEQHLKKLIAQKTGLMQDLLTGKVPVTPLLKHNNNHNQDQMQEGANV